MTAALVGGAGLFVWIVLTPLGSDTSPGLVTGGSSSPSALQGSPSATVARPPSPSPGLPSLALPIRAAFYYPWFPEAWRQQGMDPFTHYSPTLGYYETNTTTVKQQVQAMQYAGIRAGIVSWWGQKSTTDSRVAKLLQIAGVTGFEWALYYEPEGYADPPTSEIASDLVYMRDRYTSQPGYLRVSGRPVLFVYADANDSCGMAHRWKQANTLGFYLVLKVFAGYRACANHPDGWHQYAPAKAEDHQAGFSFAISPGFWKANEGSSRLARGDRRCITVADCLWFRDVSGRSSSRHVSTTLTRPCPGNWGQIISCGRRRCILHAKTRTCTQRRFGNPADLTSRCELPQERAPDRQILLAGLADIPMH
ncbi:MAG: hypothetical protein E6I00_16885 [Chloroflexi bacterium]|nr:MAG: hypothetical protein E6I00_16885 [Chloroflexota bacterium]